MKKQEELVVYSSSLTSKGSLIEETINVLELVDNGLKKGEIKKRILENGIAGGDTYGTRESIWKDINSRYLTNNKHLGTIAKFIINAPDQDTQKFALFYELCQSSPILKDTTIECVYPRYTAGFSNIRSGIILQYFDEKAENHPEINNWSNSTKEKLAGNILTILRDFGLLIGKNTKKYHRLYIPLPTFTYVLYRLSEQGLKSALEIINAEEWKLYFLEREDILLFLNEASKNGFCTFKHQGDIYSLDLKYQSLEEYVSGFTR